MAYLSADFRYHPVGFVIPEVIERHDRRRVEVIGYSTGIDDGSEIRARLARGFDRFIDLSATSIPDTVDRIRADDVDILVDLQGWTTDCRPELLALRCAPIQVSWLGFAGTMGDRRLADYVIGDPVVTPLGDAECFTEHIAQLPDCYLPFDTTRRLEAAPTRASQGLPDQGFVFCSLNNNYKFNPPTFDLWCSLLRDLPGSVLWLSRPRASAVDNLRQEAARRGIDPERIVFAVRVESPADHLARLQLADLALDPAPYNSHSSGMDTLWAGVPMVTLLGQAFAGRVGASLLQAAGLDEMVTASPQDYCALALGLARDAERLGALRRRLREGRGDSRLFDMARYAAALEGLYEQMWRNHQAGRHQAIAAAQSTA